ncbi:MAG TPA: hypothetical protein PLL02_04660 [Bacteroidales bacterium]|nr:hypothetical protein [Bacteroidales bacterium]
MTKQHNKKSTTGNRRLAQWRIHSVKLGVSVPLNAPTLSMSEGEISSSKTNKKNTANKPIFSRKYFDFFIA